MKNYADRPSWLKALEFNRESYLIKIQSIKVKLEKWYTKNHLKID